MKFSYSTDKCCSTPVEAMVYFVPKFDKLSNKWLKQIDKANGTLNAMLEAGEFCGDHGEIAVLYDFPEISAKRFILVGLGEKKKLTDDSFRKAGGYLSKNKTFKKLKNVNLCLSDFDDENYYQAVIEGLLLGSFKLLDYKSGDETEVPLSLEHIDFCCSNKKLQAKIEKAVERGLIYGEGQNLVRTLGLTPGNFLTPTIFADKAKQLARKYKLKCRILDEKALEKEKMGALLAVSKGSVEPPKFIILEHNGGPENRAPIVLVGKGVTFDSGGISLKPGMNMHEMKGDMCGGAVVVSTLVAAARLNIPQNIVGLIPTVENMPSGHATRPGDIHTSRKGLTIENINTDAEGRLILCDALDYANEFKPQAVIDIATLTGATLFILGYAGAPIMGNNQKLLDKIKDASANTSEKVWQLPIWDEHRDQMKSSIADLVNSGGRPAGTITAAAFLENFIGDYPWAHIDIAYVDIEPKGQAYIPKGITGIGMRLLTDVLANWKKL